MEHIRVNVTNFVIITLSAGIGLSLMSYVLVWFAQRSIPLLTPLAHAMLAIFRHINYTQSA